MSLVRLFSIGAVSLAAACGSSYEPNPQPQNGNTVSVGDNFFNPNNLQVSVGQAVTWQWVGSALHNITFDSGDPGSGDRNSGSFQRTFQTAGAHSYFCSIHGKAVMSGTVQVGTSTGGGSTGGGDTNPPGYPTRDG